MLQCAMHISRNRMLSGVESVLSFSDNERKQLARVVDMMERARDIVEGEEYTDLMLGQVEHNLRELLDGVVVRETYDPLF